MTKSELRTQFLAERRALSADAVAERSIQITDQFFNLPIDLTQPLYVHTFLPIIRQHEVNTWPIIRRLWQAYPAVQVVVSVTDTVTNHLTHFPLTPNTTLVNNRWGIPEPADSTVSIIQAPQIDVVLVPLLAFDRQGHRVGYGKGYYDRFLAECRPGCQKIGLSLFEPVERIKAIEPTDICLNACLTPEQNWSFA